MLRGRDLSLRRVHNKQVMPPSRSQRGPNLQKQREAPRLVSVDLAVGAPFDLARSQVGVRCHTPVEDVTVVLLLGA